MIPRPDKLRRRQPPHKRRRVPVLPLPRPLREVAAHHQQRGLAAFDVLDDPLHHGRVDAAEVNVGEVGDGAHDVRGIFYKVGKPARGNPKSEARNPKQTQRTEIQSTKRRGDPPVSCFLLWILDLIRISCFGFRISAQRLYGFPAPSSLAAAWVLGVISTW